MSDNINSNFEILGMFWELLEFCTLQTFHQDLKHYVRVQSLKKVWVSNGTSSLWVCHKSERVVELLWHTSYWLDLGQNHWICFSTSFKENSSGTHFEKGIFCESVPRVVVEVLYMKFHNQYTSALFAAPKPHVHPSYANDNFRPKIAKYVSKSLDIFLNKFQRNLINNWFSKGYLLWKCT